MRNAGWVAIGVGFGALAATLLIGVAALADERNRRRRRVLVLAPLRVGNTPTIVARCGKCGRGLTTKQIAGVGEAGRLCSSCLIVSSP